MKPLDASIHALGVALALTTAAKAQTIIHVDDDAPDHGDGSTWESAFNDLQDAIDAIDPWGNPGEYEIRIADGTYRPDRGTGDRWAAFEIGNEELQSAVTLKIRGGFAGLLSLTDPDRQDPTVFRSVLDGDLNGDDLPNLGNREDNSRRVLEIDADEPFSVVVDGLVVRGATNLGAVFRGFTRVSRCSIEDNSFTGASSSNANSQTFINCSFSNNANGVGLFVGRNTDIVGCAFVANREGFGSSERGIRVMNCLIYGNSIHGIQSGSLADVYNSILWANGDGSLGDQVGRIFPTHSIIQGFEGDWGGNTGDHPRFIDEIGRDGVPLSGDEDFRVRYHSPARDTALPGILPPDLADLDGDGDRAEPIPVDLFGIARSLNRSLDMGPYEICTPDMTGSSDPRDPTYDIPNGNIDADDWFFFLDMFVLADERADLTGSSDPDDPTYGIPDGIIGVDDYFYFLDAFARGCDPD